MENNLSVNEIKNLTNELNLKSPLSDDVIAAMDDHIDSDILKIGDCKQDSINTGSINNSSIMSTDIDDDRKEVKKTFKKPPPIRTDYDNDYDAQSNNATLIDDDEIPQPSNYIDLQRSQSNTNTTDWNGTPVTPITPLTPQPNEINNHHNHNNNNRYHNNNNINNNNCHNTNHVKRHKSDQQIFHNSGIHMRQQTHPLTPTAAQTKLFNKKSVNNHASGIQSQPSSPFYITHPYQFNNRGQSPSISNTGNNTIYVHTPSFTNNNSNNNINNSGIHTPSAVRNIYSQYNGNNNGNTCSPRFTQTNTPHSWNFAKNNVTIGTPQSTGHSPYFPSSVPSFGYQHSQTMLQPFNLNSNSNTCTAQLTNHNSNNSNNGNNNNHHHASIQNNTAQQPQSQQQQQQSTSFPILPNPTNNNENNSNNPNHNNNNNKNNNNKKNKNNMDLKQINIYLNQLIQKKKFDEAWSYINIAISRQKIIPDIFTMTILLKGCRHRTDLNTAKKIWDMMDKFKIDANAHSMGEMIGIYFKKHKINEAHELFNKFLLKKAPTASRDDNVKIWSIYLNGLVSNKKLNLAMNSYNSMLTQYNIKPDIFIINTLLKGCRKNGDLKTGIKLWESMFEYDHIHPDQYTFMEMMCLYTKKNEITKVLMLLDKYANDSKLKPKNGKMFNICLNKLVENDDLEKAMKVFKKMIGEYHINPDIVTIGTLLKGCRIRGDIKIAQTVWNSMIEFNIQPNSYAYAEIRRIYDQSGATGAPQPRIK